MSKEVVRHIRLGAVELRQCCISNNYYTRGDNEAYEGLFNKLFQHENNVTEDLLLTLAEDIYDHSNMEELKDYGYSKNGCLGVIIGQLDKYSDTVFEVVEKDLEYNLDDIEIED